MSLIKRITGVEDESNIKMKQAVGAIMIIANTKISDERIDVVIKSSQEDEIHIHRNLKIKELAEISAKEEGFNVFENDKTECLIPVGYNASLLLREDQELIIKLSKLNTTKEYKIFQTITAEVTNLYRSWTSNAIPVNTSSEMVNLEGVTRMLLNKSNAIKNVTTNFSKTTSDMTQQELIIANRLMNDLVEVSIVDGVAVFGVGTLIEVPEVIMAKNVNVTTDETTSVRYLLERIKSV